MLNWLKVTLAVIISEMKNKYSGYKQHHFSYALVAFNLEVGDVSDRFRKES